MSRENSYATLDADGQIPIDQLDNAPGSHPDLAAHNTLGLATQAELDAHATATHAATQAAAEATAAAALSGHAAAGDPHSGYATDGDLTTHAATAHGLASHAIDGAFHSGASVLPTAGQKNALAGTSGTPGTGNEYVTTQDARNSDARTPTAHAHLDADIPAGIARDSEVATAVLDHEGLANPHSGYLTSAEGDAAYEAAGGIATHSADTTSVHGIADTSVLATDAEVATAVSDHAAAANPHPTYLTAAEGDAAYQPLDSDLTAIAALTTTAFGRGLLALADAAALGAAHSHSGATTTYAPGSFTVATGNYAVMVKGLQLTTTQRVTLQGTSRLRIT